MSSNLSIRQAVSYAVGTAGAAAASLGYAPLALGADAAGPTAAPDTSLQEVVVTGSRIRRVDAETANPVFVIDQQSIKNSGISTVGDLLQRIPAVSGAATNPNVNNGGGYAESTIELRGLSSKRTLVLVDGRRQGIIGPSDATDVNLIPINLIERVEVLKEGAGAVYGSDAVSGVVNFITRKNVEGLEIHADYGRTTRSDGGHHGVDAIFGTSTDKWNFQAGATYLKQDAVYAGARDFSKYALYLYGGTTGAYHSGSSRTPTGRIFLPRGSAARTQFGCGSVTRIGPLDGSGPATGTSLADYRCFKGSFSNGDRFNYQPFNLLTTPVERTTAFTKVNYDINEFASAYASVVFTHTQSNTELAPLPFDSPVDDVVISKNNIYNPFGLDFGGLTSGNSAALWRLVGLSDRRQFAQVDTAVFHSGLKGKVGNTGWNYDFHVGYSRELFTANATGYFLKSKMQAAVGPSFIDPVLGPRCGTAALPIANCTPLNIFNIFAPGQNAILNSTAVTNTNQGSLTTKTTSLDFDGKIIDLPAGALQASVGFDYSGEEGVFSPSALAIAGPPLYLQCLVSNEVCTGPTRGHYNAKEAYFELFVPVLKDLPGVKALNLDIGGRYSRYSLFGSTFNPDFKLEYRPINDLLVRGTFSHVFRVPTITDLYAAPQNTSVTFNDPCNGLTSAKLAATPNLALACKGVAPNTGFVEPNGQITGLNLGNPALKPEKGTVRTFGLVYDPSWLSGLSIDVDYWEYRLTKLITTLDSNYSITQCVATGDPTFCNLVTRYTTGALAGQVLVFNQPTFNLSSLRTDGVDLGIHYALKNTPIGSFQLGMDITDTMSYLNLPAPGAAPQQIAGTYNKQFGNYAKYRALGSVGWVFQGADALVTMRYIHHLNVTNPSVSGVKADGVTPFGDLRIGSVIYVDATVGYEFPTKTKMMVGIRNVADKLPPILFQNNVVNADTDVNTYDTLGRQWWVGFSQKL